VPELRKDDPTRRVHLVDDVLPSRQRRLAVQHRDVTLVETGVAQRRGMLDADSLGDDQSGLALGPAPVVGGDIRARHTARRELPRHRRHDDAILQCQTAHGKGAEQRCS
jgi:hypothetical protein